MELNLCDLGTSCFYANVNLLKSRTDRNDYIDIVNNHVLPMVQTLFVTGSFSNLKVQLINLNYWIQRSRTMIRTSNNINLSLSLCDTAFRFGGYISETFMSYHGGWLSECIHEELYDISLAKLQDFDNWNSGRIKTFFNCKVCRPYQPLGDHRCISASWKVLYNICFWQQ